MSLPRFDLDTKRGQRVFKPTGIPGATVNIYGAGIAGLALACALRQKCIPYNIYDPRPDVGGHSYGINLLSWAYGSVVDFLDPPMKPYDFRRATAVDACFGRRGRIYSSDLPSFTHYRAIDSEVRKVLAQGHDIHWNHKITNVQLEKSTTHLTFENGSTKHSRFLVDAGGEQSAFRNILLPSSQATVLPYVVYAGRRRITHSEYRDAGYAEYFGTYNAAWQYPDKQGEPFLTVSKVHLWPDQKSNAAGAVVGDMPDIELRWTYSRPANGPSDPLYRPNRPKDEATKIPEAFYQEVAQLQKERLSSLMYKLFDDAEQLKNDRVLHWLQRKRLVSKNTLLVLADKKIVLLGDSAHGLPNLQSKGASYAMYDAVRFAEHLQGYLAGQSQLRDYFEPMHALWKEEVEMAEKELERIHDPMLIKRYPARPTEQLHVARSKSI